MIVSHLRDAKLIVSVLSEPMNRELTSYKKDQGKEREREKRKGQRTGLWAGAPGAVHCRNGADEPSIFPRVGLPHVLARVIHLLIKERKALWPRHGDHWDMMVAFRRSATRV